MMVKVESVALKSSYSNLNLISPVVLLTHTVGRTFIAQTGKCKQCVVSMEQLIEHPQVILL